LIYSIGGLGITLKATALFDRLLSFGAVGIITLPAFQNIGMSLNVIPVKGASLPFVSYGGTQMLTNMFFVGVTLNVLKGLRLPAFIRH